MLENSDIVEFIRYTFYYHFKETEQIPNVFHGVDPEVSVINYFKRSRTQPKFIPYIGSIQCDDVIVYFICSICINICYVWYLVYVTDYIIIYSICYSLDKYTVYSFICTAAT